MEKVEDFERIKSYYDKFEMDRLFDRPLLNELELLRFNRMEYLCQEEEEMTHLMFFVEGKVKVFRTLMNGKSLLISIYDPFEIIGDVELIKGRRTSSNAQALTTCYVLALNMETARKRLGNDLTFLKFTCSVLAEKLHELGSSSSVNLYYPLENRLASYILAVASTVKLEGQDEKRIFNENLTHLAELMGTSYRHLLRTLNGLVQKEVITKSEKGYILSDEIALEKLAGDLF